MTKYLLIAGLAFFLSGCGALMAPGRIYTNVTQPHSTDFHNTPVGTKRCVLDEHRLKEPVSGYGAMVEWNTDQIRSAARDAGITNIAYTEVQTLSILLGTYRRRRLIIYGD